MTERRRSERYPIALPVVIKGANGSETTLSTDASAEGIVVFSTADLPTKQYVELQIELPDELGAFSVTSMVTRKIPRIEDRLGNIGAAFAFDFYLFDNKGKAVWAQLIQRLRAEVIPRFSDPPPPIEPSGLPTARPSRPPPSSRSTQPDELLPTSGPEPPPTFLIKPRDLGRLWAFFRGELQNRRVRIESPVLKPTGTLVELVVIHPTSNVEWTLSGQIASVSEHGRGKGPMLEIGIDGIGEAEHALFREFVETGQVQRRLQERAQPPQLASAAERRTDPPSLAIPASKPSVSDLLEPRLIEEPPPVPLTSPAPAREKSAATAGRPLEPNPSEDLPSTQAPDLGGPPLERSPLDRMQSLLDRLEKGAASRVQGALETEPRVAVHRDQPVLPTVTDEPSAADTLDEPPTGRPFAAFFQEFMPAALATPEGQAAHQAKLDALERAALSDEMLLEEDAGAGFEDEIDTNRERASLPLLKPRRLTPSEEPSAAQPSAPAPRAAAPVDTQSEVRRSKVGSQPPQEMAPRVVGIGPTEPPESSESGVDLQWAARQQIPKIQTKTAPHRSVSTAGLDPDLDRDIALARARVVRRPENATAVYQLGMLLGRRGDLAGRQEALTALQRVVLLEPNHPGAHYAVAELFADEGDMERAAEHLRRARRLGYRIEPDLERRVAAGQKPDA